MARLLHRVSVFDQLIAADIVQSFDLPTNPLSVILLCIRPLNDTGTLLNYQNLLGIAGSMNRISILLRGSSIFSMSGRDVVAYNYHRHGIVPQEANSDNTTNERRCVVLPIILGRVAYDAQSCLPHSHRGELTMELDIDIAATGYDGLRISVETIELLTANPKFAERKITLTQTWAATGDNDINLPVGNLLRGALLFGTTPFGGAVPAPSWGRVSLYMDGEQHSYAGMDFEVGTMLGQLMGRQPYGADDHRHTHTEVAPGVIETDTGRPGVGTSNGMENYAWMDFDPTRDDSYSVDSSKAVQLFLRANAETANAVRVVSIERLAV